MGEADLPTNMMVEKQKVIIDQLRHKLELDLNDFDKLSPEDLRHAVDKAIGQVNQSYHMYQIETFTLKPYTNIY